MDRGWLARRSQFHLLGRADDESSTPKWATGREIRSLARFLNKSYKQARDTHPKIAEVFLEAPGHPLETKSQGLKVTAEATTRRRQSKKATRPQEVSG
ncbi:hypothetical protein Ae201684P_006626 [Aphanomyces euteiches]|nr:hypothetical protein Ae201684P_006626 [Aphanomyces euteiches]